jgi:hypothetical protein
MKQPLNLHRQDSVQVERLQEKIAGQGSQVEIQSARSAAQSRSQGQGLGHTVVTPSQVTDPRWPGQLWSAAEQLLLPLQPMVPPAPQFAEALQADFPRTGRFAVGTGAGALARLARKA